jgi:DNA-binding NarL/FixJ family response regulator
MMSKTKIFLIEDDPFIIDLVNEALAGRPDLELIGTARNLQSAVELAPKSNADLFLVDLGLPDGHGEVVLSQIAAAYPNSHRMVFSVFDNAERFAKALRAGATGYVLKGCEPEELLESLDRLLAGDAPMPPMLAKMLLEHFRFNPPSAPVPTEPAAADDDDHVQVEADGKVSLSPREVDVLKLAKLGWGNKAIARELAIGESTVQTHFKKIFKKLQVSNRIQALDKAGAQNWT